MNGIWQGTKKNEMGESLPTQKIQKNRRGRRGAGGMGLGPKTFDSKRISRRSARLSVGGGLQAPLRAAVRSG